MPLVLQGFDKTITFLDAFEIDLSHEMNDKISKAMRPIQTKARGFISSAVPQGLSGWAKPPKTEVSGWRDFPIFNVGVMRAGIQYHPGLQTQTRRGFQRAYSVTNESAAGAIYETAGRKHPHGTPNKSRSGVVDWNGKFHANPEAGEHFIDALNVAHPIVRAKRPVGSKGRSKKTSNGRAIFKAWNEDQGKVIGAVNAAIRKASTDFNKRNTTLKVPS